MLSLKWKSKHRGCWNISGGVGCGRRALAATRLVVMYSYAYADVGMTAMLYAPMRAAMNLQSCER